LQLYAKASDLHEIFTEGGQWATEQMINFGVTPEHGLDTGIVFRIRQEVRKVVNGHSFILILQMAALIRCALAEVRTVAVLLVIYICKYMARTLRSSKDGD